MFGFCLNCRGLTLKNSTMKTKAFIIFSFLAAFSLTSCLCSDPSPRSSSERAAFDEDIQKLTAYNVAEQYVSQRLKSPSSAVFPSSSDKSNHVTKVTSKIYTVDSWVDSQNSFGAMIRTKFHLKVTFEGDNAKVSDFSSHE